MSTSLRERMLVRPGHPPKLQDVDPRETFGYDKADAEEELERGRVRLESLQERLWAGKGGAVLVVLQGIDTSGKDGTIRHVMAAFNPQSCTVTGFDVPTPEELAHDYLWRVHQPAPARGTIAIFNRSHYEDVLVVRVHDLVPKDVWSQRYEQINRFEEHLAANGTTIVKFFLHISKEEQRERLQARIDTPDKRWKSKSGDLVERKRWDDYIAAYEDVLERCSPRIAPWYIVPADRKWFRNICVAQILAETMDELDLRYPEPEEGIVGTIVE